MAGKGKDFVEEKGREKNKEVPTLPIEDDGRIVSSSVSPAGELAHTTTHTMVMRDGRAMTIVVDHKKTSSTTSTGSNVTLKRKSSSDTITTRTSVGAASSSNATAKTPTKKKSTPSTQSVIKENQPLPSLPAAPRGAMLEIGIPCIISSKRKRFKAYARYIGEVEGEHGPWVGVEVPVGESWGGDWDMDGDRQWNDGTWGGIRYFDIGGAADSEWEYNGGGYGDDRASRRRRLDWSGSGASESSIMGAKGVLKREGDQLSVRMAKRFRSISPATSDASGTETRGLFVRPQQVLYVVDAVGSDL
jgi:hypothetical protein